MLGLLPPLVPSADDTYHPWEGMFQSRLNPWQDCCGPPLPGDRQSTCTPPPPCASTALSKPGVGVEPLFLGIFGTTVFEVSDVARDLNTFYRTLPPDNVCFDVILSHSCYSPSTAYHHLHLRALLDVGSHVCLPSCVPHASTVLSKHGVGVEPLFCLGFWDRGRACARGGGRGNTSPGKSTPLNNTILSKCKQA